MIDEGYYTLNDIRKSIGRLGLLFKFWRPIEVKVDFHEPFTMYRGDTLTVAQPNFNFSLLDRILARIHGVKLYNDENV